MNFICIENQLTAVIAIAIATATASIENSKSKGINSSAV